MEFALGFIAGIVICVFVAAVGLFFKAPLIQMTNQVTKAISLVGPRPKGFIFEPESEAEITRQEVIARNSEQGKDTHISELM